MKSGRAERAETEFAAAENHCRRIFSELVFIWAPAAGRHAGGAIRGVRVIERDAGAARTTIAVAVAFFSMFGLLPTCGAAESIDPDPAIAYARDLESGDDKVRREAAYQLGRLGVGARAALPQLIKALEDNQQQVWFGAVSALAHLGAAAEPALPALMNELESWQSFRRDRQGSQALYRTALALGSIGVPAFPSLSNALSSPKWFVRAGAAMAIGFAGTSAGPLAVPVTRLLRDERNEVREAASETLTRLGPAALGPLAAMLEGDEQPKARAAAALTLGRLTSVAGDLTQALERTSLTDADPEVRARALVAYSRVERDSGKKIRLLLKAWDGTDDAVRRASRSALLTVRPVEMPLLSELLARLDSAEAAARIRAAELLADLGTRASGAAEPVARKLRTLGATDPQRDALVRALAAMGEAGLIAVFDALRDVPVAELDSAVWTFATLRKVDVGVLSVLVEALLHESPSVRAGALEALTALGDRARSAAKRLPALLDDPDSPIRARAWEAAAACGVAPEALLSRLEKGLDDSDPAVRRSVVFGLARLGKGARPAVPKLVTILESDDVSLTLPAVRALAAIGADADAAVPQLVRCLSKGDAIAPREVLTALGAIGSASARESAGILPMADSADPEIRMAWMEAVSQFGEAGKPFLERVRRGADDAAPAVRAAAIRATLTIEQGADDAIRLGVIGLDDPDASVRRASALALAKWEERARSGEAKLFAMLEHPDEREAAKEALRGIHPTSIPSLMGALAHSDWGVREMAADALARHGKGASEAVGALEKLVRDDSYEAVKRAARRALRRIREG